MVLVFCRLLVSHKYYYTTSGDIVYLSILNKNVVIVNSAQMAIDMQDSKGSIYSDRHLAPMMKLTGWSNLVSFANPGSFFRQQRGYMHKLFGTPAALSEQHNIIEGETHRFLQHVLFSPDDLADYVRQYGHVL
jgi:hypothetical protein